MNLTIRPEEPRDHFPVECLTREAFWNLMVPGCDEHLLVHRMRRCASFVPELNFVAEVDGTLAGSILYMRSKVVSEDGTEWETLIFGPLSVLPKYQKQGVGGALLRHTLALARQLGYRAVLIFGHPEYYPRFGFVPAERYGIATAEGKNFDAFLALELYRGALDGVRGRYHFDPVYENLDPADVEVFDRRFPPREKHAPTNPIAH